MSDHIKSIQVSGFDLRALEVSADGRHVPYVGSVQWDSTTLTIHQSPYASVPGVEHWVLPGATLIEGSWVSRLGIANQSSELSCNSPAIFRFEVAP